MYMYMYLHCVHCRSLYGSAALGGANLRMIELARRHGSAAKFPGSGGAIVGLCVDQQKLVRHPGCATYRATCVCGVCYIIMLYKCIPK